MANDNPHGDGAQPSTILGGIAALLMGVALGAAAVMLLSPKAGDQLRAAVGSGPDEWKEKLATAIAHGREKVVNSVEEARRRES